VAFLAGATVRAILREFLDVFGSYRAAEAATGVPRSTIQGILTQPGRGVSLGTTRQTIDAYQYYRPEVTREGFHSIRFEAPVWLPSQLAQLQAPFGYGAFSITTREEGDLDYPSGYRTYTPFGDDRVSVGQMIDRQRIDPATIENIVFKRESP
jgi:hypothetical protein